VTYETVDWSQARYDDYGFIALDVTPAAHGQTTTMVLRFINEQGRELDRVVFSRASGGYPRVAAWKTLGGAFGRRQRAGQRCR
jgi:hypothetical protein